MLHAVGSAGNAENDVGAGGHAQLLSCRAENDPLELRSQSLWEACVIGLCDALNDVPQLLLRARPGVLLLISV
jgi:hypothetical protein